MLKNGSIFLLMSLLIVSVSGCYTIVGYQQEPEQAVYDREIIVDSGYNDYEYYYDEPIYNDYYYSPYYGLWDSYYRYSYWNYPFFSSRYYDNYYRYNYNNYYSAPSKKPETRQRRSTSVRTITRPDNRPEINLNIGNTDRNSRTTRKRKPNNIIQRVLRSYEDSKKSSNNDNKRGAKSRRTSRKDDEER